MQNKDNKTLRIEWIIAITVAIIGCIGTIIGGILSGPIIERIFKENSTPAVISVTTPEPSLIDESVISPSYTTEPITDEPTPFPTNTLSPINSPTSSPTKTPVTPTVTPIPPTDTLVPSPTQTPFTIILDMTFTYLNDGGVNVDEIKNYTVTLVKIEYLDYGNMRWYFYAWNQTDKDRYVSFNFDETYLADTQSGERYSIEGSSFGLSTGSIDQKVEPGLREDFWLEFREPSGTTTFKLFHKRKLYPGMIPPFTISLPTP